MGILALLATAPQAALTETLIEALIEAPNASLKRLYEERRRSMNECPLRPFQ